MAADGKIGVVDVSRPYDLIIAGGGNAALCAAITARQAGCSVLVLEHAPRHMRGGNSRHTRNLRVMHDQPFDVLTGTYAEEEYWSDLLRVTKGKTDERLARLTIKGSREALPFMAQCGVKFQPALSGTLSLGRTNAFFLGGGKALMNAYYAHAERIGIDVIVRNRGDGLENGGRLRSLRPKSSGEGVRGTLSCRAVIAASGAVFRPIWNGWCGPGAKPPTISSFAAPPMRKALFRGT